MGTMAKLVVMAFLVEATWETLKMTWQDGKASIDRIGALFIGLALAFAINVDILSVAGLDSGLQYVGTVLTGILISRGSNFMHDLINKLGSGKEVK